MVALGVEPLVFSVRQPDDPPSCAEPFAVNVEYFPEERALREEVDAAIRRHDLSRKARRAIKVGREARDSQRIFEAVWLAAKLRAAGVRHVHAHFGGVAARVAWWLRELFGFTYSFTGHANDIFCETDYPVTNTRLACDARFVITETAYSQRWLEERYPAIRGRVFRVFNGIRLAGFPPRAKETGAPLIVSVGRCVEKKGYPELVAACAILRDRGLAFRAEIIGDGPLFAELEAQIGALNLGACVALLGPRPQSDVRARLAAARVFALACRKESDGGSDNLPTVVMEAMACGTAVISTPLAGIPEMVDDGESGLLVPERDVPALAQALERLLTDGVLAARFGARGKALAAERFAVENSAAELARLMVSQAGVAIPSSAAVTNLPPPPPWWRAWFLR
jgi:glycosyltransferase involved in cell wall biosynthesis